MTNLTSKLDSVLSVDIEKEGIAVATSLLQQRANEIRQQRISWQSYLSSSMINQEDFQFITQFEAKFGERERFLKENSHQCAKTFVSLLGNISKDTTLSYILCLLDEMLTEDKSRVEIFKEYSKKKKESVWTPFLNLLHRNDGFIQNMTARIIAKIACWSKEGLMDGQDLNLYINWLKDQLNMKNNDFRQAVVSCLQMMLRTNEYREVFVTNDGIKTIVSVLNGRVNFQIQYQLVFCLWIMTFNTGLAERMNRYHVIPALADILSENVKEKVTRIILATFRNLIEKPDEMETTRDNAITMVQCKVLKQLEILNQSGQKFEDPDIKEDMDFLTEQLLSSVQDLSSFDEYSTEVKSGRLEWSPVHSSEKFWRENAIRLNEKNYELLKILIRLLETSKDALVLSVAAHDLGEYVRHYPRGKVVMSDNLGGKHLVMNLLTHEDPNVRYEALLCVQKLMVQNWEYLGKKLEKETGKTSKDVSSKA